jgi:hypothetical protein
MTTDIRNKPTLTHEDIAALNFIKRSCPFFFRNHYREGLRSRLMQALKPSDITHETLGIMQAGIRRFPVARPQAMLRIFKKNFSSPRDIQKEIDHYKILQYYLPHTHYAFSSEFMVDYTAGSEKMNLLCGLQEYVPGEGVDPWHENALLKIESSLGGQGKGPLNTALENLASFVYHTKKMILDADTIPDLAGVGNLIITPLGAVKLVDINNISRLTMEHHIPVDDKKYPVSDKSIQALYQIETRILNRPGLASDTLYRFFLDPPRMEDVRQLETAFHKETSHSVNYPSVK